MKKKWIPGKGKGGGSKKVSNCKTCGIPIPLDRPRRQGAKCILCWRTYIKVYQDAHKEWHKKAKKKWDKANPDKIAAQRKRTLLRNPIAGLMTGAKSRSTKYKVPFSITYNDLDRPKYCPVLGIELEYYNPTNPRNRKYYSPASASIDRIRPWLGYVPGNVMIISARANILKSNGTISEMRKILKFLEDHGVELPSSQLPEPQVVQVEM